MPDHSDLYEWWKDPKSLIGALIAIGGAIKAWRYRRKNPEESPQAPPLTVAETEEASSRMARLEARVREQQRLLMLTREELTDVSLSLDAARGEITQLRLTSRTDRAEVKDAIIGVTDEMARIHGRLHQIVRRLDEPSPEADGQPQ